jgi:hypothetical protein
MRQKARDREPTGVRSREMRQVLSAFVLFSLTACGSKSTDPPAGVTATASAAVASGSAAAPRPAASVGPRRDRGPRRELTFQGKLGSSTAVRLYLVQAEEITGLLAREGSEGAPSTLRGTLEGAALHLDELDGKGQVASTFDGQLTGDTATGTWAPKRGSKRPFTLGKNTPFDPRSPDFDRGYAGSIDGKNRVRAQLKRTGDKIEGYYRYSRSKDDLRLAGLIDATTGRFDLRETDSKGTVTGQLKGLALSPQVLAGEWLSSDGKRSLPLVLSASKPLPRVQSFGDIKVVPKESESQLAPFCSVSSTYPALDKEDSKNKLALNSRLKGLGLIREQKSFCEGATAGLPYTAESQYDVHATKSKKYLGFSFSSYSYSGGAHGMYDSICHVADLDKGTLTQLGTLLTPEGRPRLTALAVRKLLAENKVTKLTDAGFFEDEIKLADTPNLCVTDQGFVLSFGLYEISPYSMGTPEVSLTAAELAPLLQKNELTDAITR